MPAAEQPTIALTVAERKHRLPFGVQKEIALAAGVSRSLVSAVVNGTVNPTTPEGRRRHRRIKVLVARKLGLRVDEAFPPASNEPDAMERAS